MALRCVFVYVIDCDLLQLARYFCSGDVEVSVFHHYALNVPQYSHFTSPIRRYADIIVHRQLVSALGELSAIIVTFLMKCCHCPQVHSSYVPGSKEPSLDWYAI